MTARPERDPSCMVRGLWSEGGQVRLVTRNLNLVAEGQTSLAPQAAHPSALDLLVSALVVDLLAGLHREAARAGVKLYDAELNLSAYLANPLVALGVVGETGTAAIDSIRGSLYVSSDAGDEALEALWRLTLERAPVHSTLARCADVRIDLKPIP
jgi:hypothetical protein